MKVLSIYASANSLGAVFRDVGANVIDLSWYDVRSVNCNLKSGDVDVIVVQPLCKTYSIAGIKYHRIKNKNGDSCHEAAPRGSRRGTQARKNKEDKARIPKELCDYLVRETEKHVL